MAGRGGTRVEDLAAGVREDVARRRLFGTTAPPRRATPAVKPERELPVLPTSRNRVSGDTMKTAFSPLASYISSGRVTMRIFYYINRSAILFYSYYVLEASSQSFAVKKIWREQMCVLVVF